MTQRKRWLVAFAALGIGSAVSATLLFLANPARDSIEAYVAARDLPAGTALGADAVALEPIPLASHRSLFFARGDGPMLAGMHASHDLVSGQLIQRSDAMDSSSAVDRRLVFVPVKDVPAADPGSTVDLLVVGGTPDQPTVIPFALGVEVLSTSPGGLTLIVASRQASAFVYAAEAMRLVAVIAEPGAAAGAEGPVSSANEAMAVVGQG